METLPVLFRKNRRGKHTELTAVFPTLYEGNGLWLCYSHIGQHSACSRSWVINDTVPASRDEAAELLAELKGIYETGEDAVILKPSRRATWVMS